MNKQWNKRKKEWEQGRVELSVAIMIMLNF